MALIDTNSAWLLRWPPHSLYKDTGRRKDLCRTRLPHSETFLLLHVQAGVWPLIYNARFLAPVDSACGFCLGSPPIVQCCRAPPRSGCASQFNEATRFAQTSLAGNKTEPQLSILLFTKKHQSQTLPWESSANTATEKSKRRFSVPYVCVGERERKKKGSI